MVCPPHTTPLQSWKPTDPFTETGQDVQIPPGLPPACRDSSWNAECCAMTDSQDTCLLHPSQPGDAPALPWELHGHSTSVGWASKTPGCLSKAVVKGDQNWQRKQENFVLFSSSWFFSFGEAQSETITAKHPSTDTDLALVFPQHN